MLATSAIKDLINPSSKEKDILDKFIKLLDNHKIRYTVINNKPYFAVSNLALSKGLDTKDFSKNFVQDGHCILAGKFWKLEGQPLISFKNSWQRDGNIPFTKARSLWITNWRGAYSYLTIGHSQVSKGFQELGADSIEHLVVKQTNSSSTKLNPVLSERKENYVSEDSLQEAICALASYTTKHFKRETVVRNHLADGLTNTARTRRFDLVNYNGRNVILYELKRGELTTDHIREVIGDKGYFDLAKIKYPKKRVKLVFLADSISPSSQRLIDKFKHITFIPLSLFIESIVSDIKEDIKSESSEGLWYLYKTVLPKFVDVLPCIKQLMPSN